MPPDDRTSPTRDLLVASLADRIVAAGARRVGVDGVDGAGKTTFAAALVHALQQRATKVASVSIDDFHHRRAVRHGRGKDSPVGFWLDSYDYAAFQRDVLDAFGPGGSGRYRPASHDIDTDEQVHDGWMTAPKDSVLIVDGIFLHRDELIASWDFSIFLEVPFELTARRMAARDGSSPDPQHPSMRRYVEGQRLYLAQCTPRHRATVVIDNTDPHAPCETS